MSESLELIMNSCEDEEIIQHISHLRRRGSIPSTDIIHEFLLYLAEDQEVIFDIYRAEKLLKLLQAIHPQLRS